MKNDIAPCLSEAPSTVAVRVTETLYYYDCPIMVEAQAADGRVFIATMVADPAGENSPIWHAAEVAPETMRLCKANGVDLRDMFTGRRLGDGYYTFRGYVGDGCEAALEFIAGDAPEDWLPLSGATLHPKATPTGTPVALYHWSTEPADTFDVAEPRFRVNTQGRIYALPDWTDPRSTTIEIDAKSLLVFVGDALKLFRPHGVLNVFSFKRIWHQYWTRRLADVTWSPADARRVGRVVIVTRAQFAPIPEAGRRLWQRTKVLAVHASGIALAALFALMPLHALVADLDVGDQPYAAWVISAADAIGSLPKGIGYAMFAVAGIALLVGSCLLARLPGRSPRPDVHDDLLLAVLAAREDGLLPASFILRPFEKRWPRLKAWLKDLRSRPSVRSAASS